MEDIVMALRKLSVMSKLKGKPTYVASTAAPTTVCSASWVGSLQLRDALSAL